ncbi:GNAT family N-acetyltransferase [Paenibacillus sp. PR3]|uniref:GNAT family N-acetyltransferase n=1 Tax=Paenibacillus terricola TaxID=2763503 RepID=A0ABR8N1U9_9BACL|nr:GNAT family N-acetyltransferase [Paenibacillus terricola]MBD3922149.1 GNAT family N-acetyltransferase [Paenibacillus terricola]
MDQLDKSLKIRHATHDEAPIVLELWQMSARWLNAKGIYQWRPEYFRLEQVVEFMDNGSDVYVAEHEGTIVGTYVLTWSDPMIWRELDHNDAGYIHRFAVNRDYKGLGMGTLLIHSAIEEIRRRGKKVVRLDCMAENPRLNQYYREFGFGFVRRLEFDNWAANLYEIVL